MNLCNTARDEFEQHIALDFNSGDHSEPFCIFSLQFSRDCAGEQLLDPFLFAESTAPYQN